MPGPQQNGHVPPDLLAAVALDGFRLPRTRETVAAEEHLTVCVECSTALAGLLRAVAAGRGTQPDDAVTGPPARVWTAVARRMRERSGRGPHQGGGRPAAVPVAVRLPAAVAGALVLACLWRRFRRGSASTASSAPEEGVRGGVG